MAELQAGKRYVFSYYGACPHRNPEDCTCEKNVNFLHEGKIMRVVNGTRHIVHKASDYLATLEDTDRVIHACERETECELAQLGYQMKHASKQFDGLYVWRDGRTGPFPQDQLDQITAALATFDVGGGLRVPMKLAEKDVKSPYSITQRVAQQAGPDDGSDISSLL
jgi:hypothetical protein